MYESAVKADQKHMAKQQHPHPRKAFLRIFRLHASCARPAVLMPRLPNTCPTLPLSVTRGRKCSHPSLAASLKTSEEESFLDPESSDDFWLSVSCRKGQENRKMSAFAFVNICTPTFLCCEGFKFHAKSPDLINYIRKISSRIQSLH